MSKVDAISFLKLQRLGVSFLPFWPTALIDRYIHTIPLFKNRWAGVLCMDLSEFLLFSGEKKGKEEGKEGGKEEGREGRRFNNTIETCQSSQLLC